MATVEIHLEISEELKTQLQTHYGELLPIEATIIGILESDIQRKLDAKESKKNLSEIGAAMKKTAKLIENISLEDLINPALVAKSSSTDSTENNIPRSSVACNILLTKGESEMDPRARAKLEEIRNIKHPSPAPTNAMVGPLLGGR